MLRSPTVKGRERQESQGPLEQRDVCSRCGVGRSQGSREEEQSRQQGQEALPDRNLEGWEGISLGCTWRGGDREMLWEKTRRRQDTVGTSKQKP